MRVSTNGFSQIHNAVHDALGCVLVPPGIPYFCYCFLPYRVAWRPFRYAWPVSAFRASQRWMRAYLLEEQSP